MANNFMHVYTVCLGRIEVAIEIKPSVIYGICRPSFPDELRTWIFDQDNVEKLKLTEGQCKKLLEKYQKGGLPAIEADVEQMNSDQYAYRQSQYTIDLCKSYYNNFVELKVKIENRGERRPTMHFEDRFKSFEPLASEINNNLYAIVKRCNEDLERGIRDEQEKLDQMAVRQGVKI